MSKNINILGMLRKTSSLLARSDCTKSYLRIPALEVASKMRISHRHSNSSELKKIKIKINKSRENESK